MSKVGNLHPSSDLERRLLRLGRRLSFRKDTTSVGPRKIQMTPASDGDMAYRSSRGRKGGDICAIFVHAGAGYHSIQNEGLHLQACNE